MKNSFLFILFLLLAEMVLAQRDDVFEKIALQNRQEVPGLQKNPAPVLPDIILSWNDEVPKAFRPQRKITTQAQLDLELQQMREKYAPFLMDLAPPLPKVRKYKELKKFQWRLLASEMRTDENGNLYPIASMEPVGEKKWETVTIPHYTGPINKAEAIYRSEIVLTDEQLRSDRLFLHFNGVDYVAEVYMNGEKVGDHTGLFGAFEFEIRPFVRWGKNLLEVKVFNDALMMGDSFFLGDNRKFGKKLAACGGPGWNNPGLAKGWNMCPPGFGIWQKCYLEARSDAFINDLYIRPLLSESIAEVQVELLDEAGDVQLLYSLYGQNFKATLAENYAVDHPGIAPAPGAAGFKTYKFAVAIPRDQLHVWSPDNPWLYQLQVKIMKNGKLVDAAKRQFGMRSFVQSETSIPKGRFYLNGQEVKLRGANMMGNIMQCIIRNDYDQLRDDILLAKIVGMNFWRMTQQPCQQEAYEYFDKLGLLAQTDMPAFNGYRKDAVEEVKPQFVELVRLLRNHPSNVLISYLNEPDFNKPMMLDRQGHEQLFSGFDSVAGILNPGQVTKWVDGDYVNLAHKFSDHHVYNTWYGNTIRSEYFGKWSDTREGWMHACGEFGAEGLDDIQLMKKHYPPAWLQTEPDGTWKPDRIPRCQTQDIGAKWLQLASQTMDDWVQSSREYQMWATRLFTESLRRDPRMNSFAIHLLIDAWPAGWLKAIMDTERKAKPAYFAYRDALSSVAVNLRPAGFYGFSGDTGKAAVFICNDTPGKIDGATLRYYVEFDGKLLCSGSVIANVPASNPQFQGWLEVPFPEISSRNKVTVRVGLFNTLDEVIHESGYDLDVFPSSEKGKKLEFPGGYPQRLIQ